MFAMTHHLSKVYWSRLAALLAGLIVGSTADLARSQETPPKGVVYVQSNVAAAPGNQILAYQRDSDGKLTPLTGSPFSTGGAGIAPSFNLGPYDSDQEIITNPDQTRLYVTNGGSNSIAVFKFKDDGALVPLSGSPFPSGGSNPVGLALTGDKMVVVNQDNDPGNPGLESDSSAGAAEKPLAGFRLRLPRRSAPIVPVDGTGGSHPGECPSSTRRRVRSFGCSSVPPWSLDAS
jgi:DNA-binding beta-propeller fold protein YncE